MMVKNDNDKKRPIRTILMGMVCLLVVCTIVPRARVIWDLNQRKEALKRQEAHLLQVNKSLKRQNEELNSPEAIERIAREKLGMVKPGEQVLIEVETESSN
jgi:cell division protein FtsL